VGALGFKILLFVYSKFWAYFSVGFTLLAWQWELVSAFGALCHAALHYGWAASAGEGSAVAYVKGEAAFRTANNVLCLSHRVSLGLFVCF
jgi:hypothetical protein